MVSTALWGLVLVAVIVAVVAFFAGMRVGGKHEPEKIRIVVVIAGLLLFLIPSGIGFALAPKFGILIRQMMVAFGMSLSACFIAGFGYGNRKRRGSASIGALTGVLLLFAVLWLGFIGMQVQELASGAKQLGLDRSTVVKKDAPNLSLDCKASLNEIYKGFQHYVETNDALPPAEKWMDEEDFKGAVQADEWLHCPSVSNRKDANFGYAYNNALAGKKMAGKKLSEMPNAATTPLAYDSTLLEKNAHDALSSLPKPGRHGGVNSILFCDGHIDEVAPK